MLKSNGVIGSVDIDYKPCDKCENMDDWDGICKFDAMSPCDLYQLSGKTDGDLVIICKEFKRREPE